MAALPVLIDCDPGIDDTLALIYLCALHRAKEIEILGVTTTAGNAGVEATAKNAAWVTYMCGLEDIPVAAGCSHPLKVELTTTPETHGTHGLGYLPAPEIAVDAQWRPLWDKAATAGAHLIITGPLTNAATYAQEKSLRGFASMTVMGGAINYRGNTTPTAEWNFWVDPHAAADFFRHLAQSSQLATLCSLELTEKMLINPAKLESFQQALGAHSIARHLPELLRFYFEFHEQQGEGYQAQIHDLLTCMVALGKVPIESTETYVAVVDDNEMMRGTSVADLSGHWGKKPNTRLVTGTNLTAAHQEFMRAADILASRTGRKS